MNCHQRHQEQLCWFLILATIVTGILLLYCTIHTLVFHRTARSALTNFHRDMHILQRRFLRLNAREDSLNRLMNWQNGVLAKSADGADVGLLIRSSGGRRRPPSQSPWEYVLRARNVYLNVTQPSGGKL
jgi:hypothetical protein